MTITEINAFFTGNVQGVGFRYRTQKIAMDMGIRGWVKKST